MVGNIVISQSKFMGGGLAEDLANNKILVSGSDRVQILNPQNPGMYIRLPDARTLRTGGPQFYIGLPLVSSNSMALEDGGDMNVATLIRNRMISLSLVDNSTQRGTWGYRTSQLECENLLEKSEDFADAAWTKSNSAMNGCYWPDAFGGSVACLIKDDATAGVEHFVSQQETVEAAVYTLSVWARLSTVHHCILQVAEIANCHAFFDLSAGAVGTVGAGCAAAISAVYPNQYYRCSITFTSAAELETFKINIATADNVFTFNGDETHKVYLIGAQLEMASAAGCYKKNA